MAMIVNALTPHISRIIPKWGNDCHDYVTEIDSKNPMDRSLIPMGQHPFIMESGVILTDIINIESRSELGS